MANNSVVTQEVLQNTIERYHEDFVYPYQNGATHTGCVPVGSRLDGWFPTTPKYYLYCDGAEYLKSDYPELAELLAQVDEINSTTQYVGSDANHFKVPDLRGEFIRGTGINSHTNQGSGAGVGVHQNGTSMGRVVVDGENSRLTSYASDSQIPILNTDQSYNTGSSSNTFLLASASKTGQTDTPNTYTTRPTNTSLPQYICYKTHYIDLALDSFPIDISNPIDGQLLMYDATAGRWVNGGHKYSTDEHIVGTWSDGRSLYEKTFEGTTPNTPNVNQAYNTMTLPSGYNIKNIFGTINSEWQINTSYTDGSTISIISTVWFGASGYLLVRMGRERECSKNFNVTVQYTKTTDTV